jgi:hypothetical protein
MTFDEYWESTEWADSNNFSSLTREVFNAVAKQAWQAAFLEAEGVLKKEFVF